MADWRMLGHAYPRLATDRLRGTVGRHRIKPPHSGAGISPFLAPRLKVDGIWARVEWGISQTGGGFPGLCAERSTGAGLI